MSPLDLAFLFFMVVVLVKIVSLFNVFMYEQSGKTFRQELCEIFIERK